MRIALALLVACSGPGSTPKAPPPPRPVDTGPPNALPTQRTPDELTRDKAREPLATSVVDAYNNWNGLFSNLVARWSPDGAQLVFGSMRDGLPEIFTADPAQPGSPAVAITKGPERAISAQYTRDGQALLFMRDTGGDENF